MITDGSTYSNNQLELNKALGFFIGLACGDAVGTTVEFKERGSFPPLTDMVGGGPFNLKKGEWTDDTAMALCLAQSLIEKKEFNAFDQMEKYVDWMDNGYMSCAGKCFDIGTTVYDALRDYLDSGNPFSGQTDVMTSGNGCIMRLAPIPIFYHRNIQEAIHYAGESSRTTHGSILCIESSKLLCDIILKATVAKNKDDIIESLEYEPTSKEVISLKRGDFLSKSYEDLTGSGYVINSLETALSCFYNTDSFKEAILKCANVGNDADTTSAICGQVAGAYYGIEAIPIEWRKNLAKYDLVEELTIALLKA